MALTNGFVEAHITKWQVELHKPYYPYRVKWPSRLFHHAPIENAVKILRDGNLRSRSDPANDRAKDVAAVGVIDARDHAHSFARLYFRPRTPTQWHIEGIRKAGECQYGNESHAPVLVMMVFDARRVLSRPGTKFCDRNMQLGAAEIGQSEEQFQEIPFEKVYHEGSTGGDRSITNHRCAEVLAQSPLVLADTLRWIYCRTAAERDTLLYLLGDQADNWHGQIVISDDLLVFERKYTFVEEIMLAPDGLIFQLRPRSDFKSIDVEIKVWNINNVQVIDFRNTEMPAVPPYPITKWRIEAKLPSGVFLVQVVLEGHLAFKAYVSNGADLV